MSAISRLWRRAPLWRLTVYGSVFFTGLAVLYPAGYLNRAVPFLKRPHFSADAASAPTSSGTPSDAAANTPGDNTRHGRLTFLPLGEDVAGTVPLGGHQVPLPAGTWHPVLAAQAGPGNRLLNSIYVRTDAGVVTGLVIAAYTTQPIPDPDPGSLLSVCHDDRSIARAVLHADKQMQSCWGLGPVAVSDSSITGDPVLSAAFTRLHELGFPMPPRFLALAWVRLLVDPQKGVSPVQVTTLISPAASGTVQMPAPIDAWDQLNLAAYPAAARFVADMQKWAQIWTPVLDTSIAGNVNPTVIAKAARDPGAPPIR